MSIVSGYKKFKKYILTSSGFQLVSHWTNANTLQFDDGKTAQAKLGAIDGISSSKDSSSDKIAASTKLVSELNSNLDSCSFEFKDDGAYINYTLPGGADTVSKKLGDSIEPGTLVSQTSESFTHDWNKDHSHSGKTQIPCSKVTIVCGGFNNHNGSLTLYNSSGTVIQTISIINGSYTINKDDICSWRIGYNFPSGFASIGASFTVSLYK